MAWDFETEPEFEEQLAWMREFTREEIFPIETLELSYEDVLKVIAPLQDEVRQRGLWAAHLPPECSARAPLGHWCSGTTPRTRATPSCSPSAWR